MAILLIDPNDGQRAATQRFLQRVGYSVDAASDATTARERMAGRHYEFVVLTQHLPDCDGLVLLRESIRRGKRASAFILLTGTEDVEDRLRGFDAGADDCLAASVRWRSWSSGCASSRGSGLDCRARAFISGPGLRWIWRGGYCATAPTPWT